MRAAPPVRITVAPSLAWRTVCAAVPAAAAAALAAWALEWAGLHAAAWAALAVLALVAAAAWRWWPVDAGPLGWDGAGWSSCERRGEVRVMIDFDTWMLLRFDAAAPRRRAWLAVSARSAGAHWHALRAAVYSRGPS